jgi:hypoxanthine phosphoribosyltransferase
MTEMDPREILKNSTLLADSSEVRQAVERMAAAINEHYADQEIIFLIVMTGAVMPAAWLASKLTMPMQMELRRGDPRR